MLTETMASAFITNQLASSYGQYLDRGMKLQIRETDATGWPNTKSAGYTDPHYNDDYNQLIESIAQVSGKDVEFVKSHVELV
ncbi:hypothetical protein [Spirosoma sp. 209]|uniref:hypothetical protein n=1 Tax=Spirosoma sp. 209 TaxID=1955701 RepID=UPI00098D25A9|nr:hypothetical protein [Spirosoma sp. 209]